MLHNLIHKVLKKSEKVPKSAPRMSILSSALMSSKEIYFDTDEKNENFANNINIINPNIAIKEVSSFSPSRANFSKRHTLFKARYSQDNKIFSSELLESKNRRINELEAKIKEVSRLLYELALKLRESLKLEEVFYRFPQVFLCFYEDFRRRNQEFTSNRRYFGEIKGQ